MFGKVFASTFTGSMFGAGPHIFAVWAFALANASRDGTVEINPLLLAAALGTTPEVVEEALRFLCSPDPRSRSPELEGRRLTHDGAFGYTIVNYAKYREIRSEEDRREQNRLAQQAYRDRKRNVSTRKQSKPRSAQVEADGEAEADAEGEADKDTDTESPSGSAAACARRVFAAWQRECKYPNTKLVPSRVAMITSLLKLGYSEATMLEAIRRIAASPFHQGENDRHRRFDSFELIFRSGPQLEKYANLEAKGGGPTTAVGRLREQLEMAVAVGNKAEVQRLRVAVYEAEKEKAAE